MPLSRLKLPLLLTALFAFLGFADATYLTVDHYLALPVPCSLSGGCETVLKSAYAMVGPIPLALGGALYYLVALALVLAIFTSLRPERSRAAAKAIVALSGIGFIASAYLIYVQAALLRAFCQYCLGSALSTTLLFLSSLWLWWTVRHIEAAPATSTT